MSRIQNRKTLFLLNTLSSLLCQINSIICGFILPRYLLQYYGSETMGVVSSITQFLNFISLMQLGVGAVVQASWYKPLALGDYIGISKVYKSAENYFQKIAIIFVIYSFVLASVYPLFVSSAFNYTYLAMLILVMAFSLFAQYYWGMTNSLLIQSDQRVFITQLLSLLTTLLNTIVSVYFIVANKDILIVKILSTLVLVLNPLFLILYVKYNYNINRDIELLSEPIKQKWDGLIQHISAVIVDSAPVVFITIFLNLEYVSVYYIHNMVVISIRNLIVSLCNGVQSMFGNLLAKNEIKELIKTFDRFEIFFGFIITVLFSSTVLLIRSFVLLYTSKVNDFNYDNFLFALLLSISVAMYCYRTIYYCLIKSAGHFRETQIGALIEVLINISLSMILVKYYGIVGIAFSTFIAMLYRTIYCVWYLSKNIIYRPIMMFIRFLSTNFIAFILVGLIGYHMICDATNYIEWVINALIVTLISVTVNIIIYYCVYNSKFIDTFEYFFKIKKT